MIRKATEADISVVAQLAVQLWEGHTANELEQEMNRLQRSKNAVIFLAEQKTEPVGFAQCQLRRDYVEGTSSSPVGYLEGIFVKQKFRNQAIARQLLIMCEQWAAMQGCREFASDCELENSDSLQFHLHTGFREENRIICFTKKI